ncbi:MAG: hypothetical protein HY552_03505 [Elusimicrobia bacterium]|nr:hypothetical protein [Elusimicrobiota bacterium]
MSAGSLFAGLIFSGIGFGAFIYGRRTANVRFVVLGVALMVYPYFISGTFWLYVVGVALTGLLFLVRD